MKRILITSTELMMIQFLVPHVKYLAANGYAVEVACSNVAGRIDEVRKALDDVVKAFHTVRLERKPASLTNLKGYGDMKKIIRPGKYDIIWTNEPVMGVMTRLAARHARKAGTKVLYMCHGFHFYKGASLPSWLVFYPVERFMSRFCDVIVTINREDEARAKTFHCPRVERIDGIGVDLQRMQITCGREEKRSELGVGAEDILVLSVGELQTRKNHEVIIRALARLDHPKVKYYICGRGELLEHLQKLAAELGIQDRVFFLGYRMDIPDIMNAADIYAHPSRREGLGLACLEAMSCGLPLVTSNIQGIPDYVEDGITGFLCDPTDVLKFTEHLDALVSDPALRSQMGRTNRERVKKYAVAEMRSVICEIMCSV